MSQPDGTVLQRTFLAVGPITTPSIFSPWVASWPSFTRSNHFSRGHQKWTSSRKYHRSWANLLTRIGQMQSASPIVNYLRCQNTRKSRFKMLFPGLHLRLSSSWNSCSIIIPRSALSPVKCFLMSFSIRKQASRRNSALKRLIHDRLKIQPPIAANSA